MDQAWRWYGPEDPITLKHIKQAGVTNIVTACDDVPAGDVWPLSKLRHLRSLIEAEGGLDWTVVEVLPVSEAIKTGAPHDVWKRDIANWKESMRNLSKVGVDTICYDFMPVVNWTRTNLNYSWHDGAIALGFDYTAAVAFDLCIIEREGAAKDYTEEQVKKSRDYYKNLSAAERQDLRDTIIKGLATQESFTLESFRSAVAAYKSMDDDDVRMNLQRFLDEVVPLAEELGLYLAVHPDDPPRRLFGLPRIVSTDSDVKKLLNFQPSPHNGLTLCVGSFAAVSENDIYSMIAKHATKVNYVHLRNIMKTSEDDSFVESDHLYGDVDMVKVIRALLVERNRRMQEGDTGARVRLPMQPDHGHQMLDDLLKNGLISGYSAIGRLRGLAELRGVQMALLQELSASNGKNGSSNVASAAEEGNWKPLQWIRNRM